MASDRGPQGCRDDDVGHFPWRDGVIAKKILRDGVIEERSVMQYWNFY